MNQTAIAGTLGQWADRNFRAILIVEKYGLNFHDDADLALEDLCRARGLDPAAVAAEIDAVTQPRLPAQLDWPNLTLRQIIAHIVERHHEYLKLEIPRLRPRLDRMAMRHGERDGRLLARLHPVFCALQADIEEHLHKEEFILFPFIERYESAVESGQPAPPPPFGTIANPIAVMENEHTHVRDLLAQMREITREYVPAEYACANFRAVFHSLEELEADLLEHIRVENDILHPRAVGIERCLFG